MKKVLVLMLTLVMMVAAFTVLTSCGGNEEPPKTGEVKLVLDGGAVSGTFAGAYTVGDAAVALPTPTKAGYYFDGWYTEAAFTNKVTSVATTAEGEVKVYAKWIKNVTLSYEFLDGATITNEDAYTTEFTPGVDTVVLPTVTKDGEKFAGWFLDSNFGMAATAEAVAALKADRTLYAKWVVMTIANLDATETGDYIEQQGANPLGDGAYSFTGTNPNLYVHSDSWEDYYKILEAVNPEADTHYVKLSIEVGNVAGKQHNVWVMGLFSGPYFGAPAPTYNWNVKCDGDAVYIVAQDGTLTENLKIAELKEGELTEVTLYLTITEIDSANNKANVKIEAYNTAGELVTEPTSNGIYADRKEGGQLSIMQFIFGAANTNTADYAFMIGELNMEIIDAIPAAPAN